MKINIIRINPLLIKKWRYIASAILVLLVFALLFAWLGRANGKPRDLPQILKSGRLLVLSDGSSIGYSRQKDSVSGFQYEVIKAFADSLGVELVITERNDFQECVNSMKVGDYDIVASMMPVTTEYKKDLLFTIPFFTTHQVLVQRLNEDSTSRKSLIHNQLKLANDTIYIPSHSPYKMRLKHLSEEIAEPIKLIEMDNRNPEEMVKFVVSGIIKQTICDEQLAERLQQKYPLLDISLPIGFEQEQAWAVHKKSPKLLDKLNEFLADFMTTTEYWELYQKYFEISPEEMVAQLSEEQKVNAKKEDKKLEDKMLKNKKMGSKKKVNKSEAQKHDIKKRNSKQ